MRFSFCVFAIATMAMVASCCAIITAHRARRPITIQMNMEITPLPEPATFPRPSKRRVI